MKVVADPKEFQALALKWRRGKRSVGFVPTMGALHEGHLELVRRCRSENPLSVVSIFVNPLQFGPKEDFARYPRVLADDLALLRREKVTAVFTPSDESFYPEGFSTKLKVEGPLVSGLCAVHRTGHFDGVATVVVKLLGVVLPDRLYLGRKDYQQAAVLRRVAADLNLPVEVVTCPTVRESDGLAMSSRNSMLSPDGRRTAAALYRALRVGQGVFALGERDAKALLAKVRAVLEEEKKVKLQYLEAVHPDTLQPVESLKEGVVLALAAYVDEVRLIDNLIL
jgi:pantoate--beta-alanine ligase